MRKLYHKEASIAIIKETGKLGFSFRVGPVQIRFANLAWCNGADFWNFISGVFFYLALHLAKIFFSSF